MSIIKLDVWHLSGIEAEREIRARYGVGDISDECAATIASWWQSSGRDGSAFAALASGAECDYDALVMNIAVARDETISLPHEERQLQCMALDMLRTWMINRSA